MASPYKYLALFDYDGTIHQQGNLSDIDELKRMKDEGVLIVVTTGNGYDAALQKPKMRELADILVSDVGAVVTRNYGGDLQNRPKQAEGQWAIDLDWSAQLTNSFNKGELRNTIETPKSKGLLTYFLESDFKICYTLPKIDPDVADIKRFADEGQRNPGKMLGIMTGIDNPRLVQEILYNHIPDAQAFRTLTQNISEIAREPDDNIAVWLKNAQSEGRFSVVEDALSRAVGPVLEGAGIDTKQVNVIVSKHLGLGDTYVDVIPANIDKGTSGAYIINQLKKEQLIDENTVVIAGGDSRNDFEMHTVADYFIAVGNSNPGLLDKLKSEGRQECTLIAPQKPAAAGLLEAFEQIKALEQPGLAHNVISLPSATATLRRRM